MVKAIWAVACSMFIALTIGGPLLYDIALAEDPIEVNVLPGDESPETGLPNANEAAIHPPMPQMADNVIRVQRNSPLPKIPPSPSGYRLGPEDQLRISVWDSKELTLDLVVRPDGKISMPLIQDVVAEGLTAAQLAANIQQALAAYIVNPEVTVIVLQVNAPKYYIIGYVHRPGTYHLRNDTSLLQALALAGGLTQFASPRGIKLIRGALGKQEVRKVNYYDVIESGQGNYLLKPGDTIVVP